MKVSCLQLIRNMLNISIAGPLLFSSKLISNNNNMEGVQVDKWTIGQSDEWMDKRRLHTALCIGLKLFSTFSILLNSKVLQTICDFPCIVITKNYMLRPFHLMSLDARLSPNPNSSYAGLKIVQVLLKICSILVHFLFTTFLWLVNNLFTSCHDLSMTSHNSCHTLSWIVQDLFINCL